MRVFSRGKEEDERWEHEKCVGVHVVCVETGRARRGPWRHVQRYISSFQTTCVRPLWRVCVCVCVCGVALCVWPCACIYIHARRCLLYYK